MTFGSGIKKRAATREILSMKTEDEIRERLESLEEKPGLREELDHGQIVALTWVLDDDE
jgi:hypothetical protein